MKFVRRCIFALLRRLLFLIPASKKIAFNLKIAHWENSVEGELRHLEKLTFKKNLAIDVGANKGHYTVKMSRIFERVIAFEPNVEITKNLIAWKPDNVEIIHCALSSQPGEAVLKIPLAHGQMLDGWASLEKDNLPEAEKYIEKPVKIRRLDDFKFADVSFIKIDVEAHELEMLEGATETIAKSRPVVLIEINEKHSSAVHTYFKQRGYLMKRLSDFVSSSPTPCNFIFWPEREP